MADFILGIDTNKKPVLFELPMANRHGLIAGSTGTGKTVTLQTMVENFSRAGVPVFAADVKGDLSGLAMPADMTNAKLKERIADLKIKDYTPAGNPVVFWDLYGKNGHPLRTTISEMGPLLLGRLMELNDTQQSILEVVFSIADDQGLLLLDIKDLRSMLDWVEQNAASLKAKYGSLTSSSLGIIQRKLLTLNEAGGEIFFGEPAFDIESIFKKDASGRGIVNILDATKLISDKRMYSTFLLWLLSELFNKLPEEGDQDKPKLVFFFDEAHLLFNEAPKSLLDKIEQLVRLIRSKGIGVYFVTQNPLDIPETVLGQLGNRVQHALRAFTPKDQKSVKIAAQTFRANPNLKLNVADAITQLGVGEALASCLDLKGTPGMVEQIKVMPPCSRIGAITSAERESIIQGSPFKGVYDKVIDRESAFEVLQQKSVSEKAKQEAPPAQTKEPAEPKRRPGRPRDTLVDTVVKTTSRTVATQVGRAIVRGILGSIFGKK